MNIVVSDPKTSKAISINTEKPVYLGKKIGDEVDLSIIGLEGYKGIIKGGSDKSGFPMKPSLQGISRKRIIMEKGVGIRKTKKGLKRKKMVRGNTVAEDIAQLNIVIKEYGSKPFMEYLPKKEEKEKAEKNE